MLAGSAHEANIERIMSQQTGQMFRPSMHRLCNFYINSLID